MKGFKFTRCKNCENLHVFKINKNKLLISVVYLTALFKYA